MLTQSMGNPGNGQMFIINQNKCTYTESSSIAGNGAKENTRVTCVVYTRPGTDLIGSSATTYANRDQTFERSQGRFDARTGISGGKRWYKGGTGKLQGIEGSGTWKCKVKSSQLDAGYTCDITSKAKLPKKT